MPALIGMVTLTFELLSLKLVRSVARDVMNFITNLGVSTSIRSRIMGQHVSDRSRDLVTMTFDPEVIPCDAHVEDNGTFCVNINKPVTLTFDLFTLKVVCGIACVMGNLPTNFEVSTTIHSRVLVRQVSGRSRDLMTLTFDVRGDGACGGCGS